MTEKYNKANGEPASVTDPVAAADSAGLAIDQRTHVHENREQYQDHCESDAIGRAIVGITDADDQLLLLVSREEKAAMLPNETVAPGEDWATVGREWVEGAAGIDVTIDGIERVRRVDHEIEGEDSPESTIYHVVFGGSVPSEATIDGLCADNPFELGWHDELPVAEEEESAHVADVRLFIG